MWYVFMETSTSRSTPHHIPIMGFTQASTLLSGYLCQIIQPQGSCLIDLTTLAMSH